MVMANTNCTKWFSWNIRILLKENKKTIHQMHRIHKKRWTVHTFLFTNFAVRCNFWNVFIFISCRPIYLIHWYIMLNRNDESPSTWSDTADHIRSTVNLKINWTFVGIFLWLNSMPLILSWIIDILVALLLFMFQSFDSQKSKKKFWKKKNNSNSISLFTFDWFPLWLTRTQTKILLDFGENHLKATSPFLLSKQVIFRSISDSKLTQNLLNWTVQRTETSVLIPSLFRCDSDFYVNWIHSLLRPSFIGGKIPNGFCHFKFSNGAVAQNAIIIESLFTFVPKSPSVRSIAWKSERNVENQNNKNHHFGFSKIYRSTNYELWPKIKCIHYNWKWIQCYSIWKLNHRCYLFIRIISVFDILNGNWW